MTPAQALAAQHRRPQLPPGWAGHAADPRYAPPQKPAQGGGAVSAPKAPLKVGRAVAAVLACLVAWSAQAAPPPVGSDDWNVMAPYAHWVTAQHDAIGRWCCDVADGRPVDAVISVGNPVADALPDTGPGLRPTQSGPVLVTVPQWWVHVTRAHFPDEPERWMAVPDDKVLRQANPVGTPILWLYQGRVQCFAPADGS